MFLDAKVPETDFRRTDFDCIPIALQLTKGVITPQKI